jgi:tetrahydromethanopterin S-methyltransferase subunit C
MVDEADAGNGIKRESKYGLAVQFVLSVLATGAIGYLGTLNVSTVPGWATAAVTLAVSTAIGYLTAYKTKNTPRS